MAEVVDRDVIRLKSANVGKRKQLIEGDGGINVPGEFNKQLLKFREIKDITNSGSRNVGEKCGRAKTHQQNVR